MAARGTAVGLYQSEEAAAEVLQELRRKRFRRSALLQVNQDGKLTIRDYDVSPLAAALWGALAGLALGLVFDFIYLPGLFSVGTVSPPLLVVILTLAGSTLGALLASVMDLGVDDAVIARYREWLVKGDTMILAQAHSHDLHQALEILRRATGGTPLSFAFHPEERLPEQPDQELVRRRLLTADRLAQEAIVLAGEQKVERRPARISLLKTLREAEDTLVHVHRVLTESARTGQSLSLSGEWVLDNFYLISGHIEDVRNSLPERYYKELPVTQTGPYSGVPRVYGIAAEIVANTDALLERDLVHNYLHNYQTVSVLTMGELWAVPLMLRLRLIEAITNLSVHVERRHREREWADFWANRLLTSARRDPDRLLDLIAELSREVPNPTPHLADQLIGNLYDEESVVSLVHGWLQRKFGSPLPEIIQAEHRDQATEQQSISNAITSLRRLSQIDWRQIFEPISRVDNVLWQDPSGHYPNMEFATRDEYRHAIEELARRSRATEVQIALATVDLAEAAEDPWSQHVGYWLIDQGRHELEARIGASPRLSWRILRWVHRHPALVYVSSIFILTSALIFGVVSALVASPFSHPIVVVMGILAAVPISDVAVQLVNYLVTRLIPPRSLPKIATEEGIPREFKSLVVVPMMLLTPEAVRTELERLEIRYLANPDPNLKFALNADYADAPHQHMPEDLERLEVAIHGIEELNRRYGEGKFFLFHREREWSKSEGKWMGWERKRGKLEDMNAFLVGDSDPRIDNILRVGDPADLQRIRFIVTLDADTQTPRDTIRRLVATLAHPLNQPRLSDDRKRVVRGYTMIQPRITTSLPSATATLFSRLFTDASGLDPYSHAVSDVYQDLAGEASYVGKGIYDLHAFHDVLKDRFPEAHILSHDLIEGAHVRVGLASDIELLDLFPTDYVVFAGRQHRWTRGDWQIIDWLFPTVPALGGRRIRNPLSMLNRWKIFDNLRRSLIPPTACLLLLAGWFLSPKPALASLVVAASLLLPPLTVLVTRLTTRPNYDPRAWRDLGLTLIRSLLWCAFLPHQATVSLDAIGRVLYRRAVSHKLLLEWETAAEAHRRSKNRHRQFVIRMIWIPILSAAAMAWLMARHPAVVPSAALFLTAWAASPLIVSALNAPTRARPEASLSSGDRRMLRQIARLTWRFFDEFVGPQSNWLPPDNYQEVLRVEVAQRTSPTNIGLGLMAKVAAFDFGYITGDDLIERVVSALRVVDRLDKFEGHVLNWYDIQSLEPLEPRYISMVDSGNLLAALWTLEQALQEQLWDPVLGPEALRGLADTQDCLRISLSAESGSRLASPMDYFQRQLNPGRGTLADLVHQIRAAAAAAEKLRVRVEEAEPENEEAHYWAGRLEDQARAWNTVIDRYLSWVEVLESPPEGSMMSLGPDAHEWRREAFSEIPALGAISEGHVVGLRPLVAMHRRKEELNLSPAAEAWLDSLADSASKAQWFAGEKRADIEEALERSRKLSEQMNMRFLYNPERRLFYTGYNVSDRRMDNSHYDLLASEARLGSFVAIARGEVPTEHWWALGRPFSAAYGQRALLSWSGTMFEYLMPLLVTRSYQNSLLDDACRATVKCQIEYGRQRDIPWGISEAAYSALDARQIYQYHAFGVPGLGIKRGLEDDLVVAPYASALALMVDPVSAAQNLRRLAARGIGLRSAYGYYESVDYTRERAAEGDRGVVVYAYMSHHQGMALLALDNVLSGNVMQERFHRDARVKSAESVLYEKIPTGPALMKDFARDAPLPRVSTVLEPAATGRMDTPDTPLPRTHLLSNGAYHVVLTNAGAGCSRWKDIELTRWRADTTRDSYGQCTYVRDLETGAFWSAGHQPVGAPTQRYNVIYSADKAEYRRRDAGIETVMEVVVSPEDDAEVRLITLINRSLRTRRLEVTSYAEVSLAPHAADRAHPAFSKLFVQTEALPERNALLACRRPRASGEPESWAAHIVAIEKSVGEPVQYETDRAKFVGRGRTPQRPAAIDRPLSNSAGAVLDPVFSLRRQVVVEAGQRVQVAFVTAAAESRDQLIPLVDKYCDIRTAGRALQMAWTHAQLELRHLRIQQDDAQRFQQLASFVLYPHAQMRPSPERLARNKLGQSRLWAYGISGDLPIVLVTIGNSEDVDVVRDTLMAHSFWRHRGLKADLVILNEEAAAYDQPLNDQLTRLVQAHSQNTGTDQPGGVFLRPAAQIPEEDQILLHSVSRVVVIASRGSLGRQVSGPAPAVQLPPPLPEPKLVREEPSPPLPFMELPYFNGLGGFTRDGREYAIYLGPGDNTPLPWVNVIANPSFGTLVSESGGGFSWFGNSQSNRLTPWSNDPVCDLVTEALYIRDEETGVYWTPTPLPVRELDAYRARHGQGYTIFEHNSHAIEQELLVFVPMDSNNGAPIRIQRLRLRNRSSVRKRLTVTSYCELNLGVDREDTQLHVVTQWDAQAQALLARNPYHPDFGGRVAFAASSGQVLSYTGDRAEFVGRNGVYAAPAAMGRTRLSNRAGAGFDPCAALQVAVDLEPDREAELFFIFGQGGNVEEARELVGRFQDTEAVALSYRETVSWWDQMLSAVQVETPELGVNLLLNRWLLYQDVSCRMWGRSAFYQSGGAFGFRDQLQDCMAVVYAHPDLTRDQILRTAARQFEEGDVQHWWHPPSGAGVRTRISDDLLWLPFVTAHYVRVTGDRSILDATVPFIKGRVLDEKEHEAMFVPEPSLQTGSLMEHCRRALAKGHTSGPHGLPLIGGGDWNDGLNRVGVEGRGESVWLAWFLVHVMKDFAELLITQEEKAEAEQWRKKARRLAEAIEKSAWDGNWYVRAFFDDGTPIGAHTSEEAQIDSLPQSWSVISGEGNSERSEIALRAVEDRLFLRDPGMLLLFTPPFDHTTHDPGYIKGYLPGVRENGGQYTHGSLWTPLALARRANGAKAVEILSAMNPIEHSRNPADVDRYKVEPYVVAADIYSLQGQVGRGGWTWYTGSAGWMYRVWVEEILGLTVRGDSITLNPVIAPHWDGFRLRYRHNATVYEFTVQNPDHVSSGVRKMEMDGAALRNGRIPLSDDGVVHLVRIVMGTPAAARAAEALAAETRPSSP